MFGGVLDGADLCGGAIHGRLDNGADGYRLHGGVGGGGVFAVAGWAIGQIVSICMGWIGGVLVGGAGLVCLARRGGACGRSGGIEQALVCVLVAEIDFDGVADCGGLCAYVAQKSKTQILIFRQPESTQPF